MRPAAFQLAFCLTIGGLLAATGCAGPEKPKAPSVAAPPPPRVVGEVAVVDEEKRFVLIDLESNLYVPPPGIELRALGAGGKTARLKTSAEQNRPFIAADIVEGEPMVGDQVVK